MGEGGLEPPRSIPTTGLQPGTLSSSVTRPYSQVVILGNLMGKLGITP